MQKNIVSFKNLKSKIIKKRKEKKWKKKKGGVVGGMPQNDKSPTQRQRFITIIKSVTEYTYIHIHPKAKSKQSNKNKVQ